MGTLSEIEVEEGEPKKLLLLLLLGHNTSCFQGNRLQVESLDVLSTVQIKILHHFLVCGDSVFLLCGNHTLVVLLCSGLGEAFDRLEMPSVLYLLVSLVDDPVFQEVSDSVNVPLLLENPVLVETDHVHELDEAELPQRERIEVGLVLGYGAEVDFGEVEHFEAPGPRTLFGVGTRHRKLIPELLEAVERPLHKLVVVHERLEDDISLGDFAISQHVF